MTYVLYGDLRSGSAAVEMLLSEIGVAFSLKSVPLEAHAQQTTAYRAQNPAAKLPCLVSPEGTLMTESAAILLTLAERHPEAGLFPLNGDPARPVLLRWLFYLAAEIYSQIEIDDYPERFGPASAASEIRRLAKERLQKRWMLVEAAVEGTPWFGQTGLSIIDLYIAVLSRWSISADWRAAHLPRVEGIANALRTRPAAGSVFARHFP